MLDNEALFRQKILLSVQRSLLESVTSNLRGVAIDWNDSEIRIVCYFHGTISNDDREEMNCVHTEVVADFIDIAPIDLVLEQVDIPKRLIGPDSVIGPEKMIGHRAWAFLRKE
jgi:hypothetical protein